MAPPWHWRFARIGLELPSKSKLKALRRADRWTLVELWIYCNANLSDGFVPRADWEAIASPATRRALLANRWAHEVANGVMMHDYLDWNRSRQEVEALTKHRRSAGSRGGAAKALARNDGQASAKQVLPAPGLASAKQVLADRSAEELATPSGVASEGARAPARGARASRSPRPVAEVLAQGRHGRAQPAQDPHSHAAGIQAELTRHRAARQQAEAQRQAAEARQPEPLPVEDPPPLESPWRKSGEPDQPPPPEPPADQEPPF